MSLLSKNTLPAEILRGCVFSELFESSAKVSLNEGTITGAIPMNQDGATFDGTNDLITYPSSFANFTTQSYTVCAWIKTTSPHTGLYGIIVDTKVLDSVNGGYTLFLYNNILYFSGGSSWGGGSSASTWTDGNWHFVALVVNYNTNNLLYRDGVLNSTRTWATGSSSNFHALSIGGYSADKFNGNIRGVKIFNVALTAQEILDYYNNAPFTYRNKAVLDLPMDLASYDFTNKKVLDRSGKGNDATLGDGSTASTFPTKLSTKGFSFDGGDYLDLGDKDAYSFTDGAGNDVPFSVSIWVKPNSSNTILQKYFGANAEYIISTASDFSVIRLYTSSGNYIGRYWNKTLASFTGQWVHLVFTYDGSETNAGLKIYFNGTQVDDNNTSAGSYTGMSNTAENLYLGYSRTNPSYHNGSFSKLFIFRNITLTPLQILDLHLTGKQELNRI